MRAAAGDVMTAVQRPAGRKGPGRGLARQNTFLLDTEQEEEEEEEEEKVKPEDGRVRSTVGIKSILDRAEAMASLPPPVKQYLAAHLRMMGDENARLLAETARLREEQQAATGEHENLLRVAHQQLDREKAKNKQLRLRVKESENVQFISASTPRPTSSSGVSMDSIASTISLVSSLSRRAGTPAPLPPG